MADPLSISASIIAILQLTGTVVGYLTDLSEALEVCQKLLAEVSSVSGFLYLLKDSAERTQWNDIKLSTMSSISIRDGPLNQFKGALQELVTKLGPATGDHSLSSKITVNIFYFVFTCKDIGKLCRNPQPFCNTE